MQHYVFQVSDQSAYGKQREAREVFDFLVRDRRAWGFGKRSPNRKALEAGDKILFYLTGSSQVFVGSATLSSGAYENTPKESKDWYLDPETLRIDLTDVYVFPEPKSRHDFKNIEWRPVQGSSGKISERDFNIILGSEPDRSLTPKDSEIEMEYALEKHLEDFMVENWDKIDFGEKLELFEDEDGNKGQQYLAEGIGYIDLLTRDAQGNFVVIELKKGRENDKVIGQVLRYIGWVREHLANGKEVRGLVITGERDPKLEYALREIPTKVSAKIYKASFRLEKY